MQAGPPGGRTWAAALWGKPARTVSTTESDSLPDMPRHNSTTEAVSSTPQPQTLTEAEFLLTRQKRV